jgi:hypothetical protein
MKKWFVLAAVTAVGVAILAGNNDIRRFVRMHNM